jgi:hypothetical protein
MAQQKQAVIELVASHRSQGRTVGEVLESVGAGRSSITGGREIRERKTPFDRVRTS